MVDNAELGLVSCGRSLASLKSRVPTGQGKLEKVREFDWLGKDQGKIFFGKVRENENH